VCGMVIGTRGGLFHAGRSFDITEYPDYIAEGSGADYATGAGYILSKQKRRMNRQGVISAEATALYKAEHMVQAACHHSIECGMPVNTLSLEVSV